MRSLEGDVSGAAETTCSSAATATTGSPATTARSTARPRAGGDDLIAGGDGIDSMIGDNGSTFASAGGNGGNDLIAGGPGDDESARRRQRGSGDRKRRGRQRRHQRRPWGRLLPHGDHSRVRARPGAPATMPSTAAKATTRYLIGDHASGGTVSARRRQRPHQGRDGCRRSVIGDHNPVSGTPGGGSGNDLLFANAGDDNLHGDNLTDTGAVDSGNGRDGCHGGGGTDTACELRASDGRAVGGEGERDMVRAGPL